MKLLRYFVILFFSVTAFTQTGHARSAPESFAPMVEELMPAVVNISTTQRVKTGGFNMQFHGLPNSPEFQPFRDFFERFGQGQSNEREVTSLGSGFVIDPNGYIVTNNHVVAEAQEVTVNFSDNSSYEATVVGRDPKTDLALLKIEAGKPLPYVEFGDSDEALVGDWVIAIGNPFGLGGSVSAGIVSARSRNINSGPFDDFIQTDAAINRGNSGGPLFNIAGKVVGINSAIFSPSGGNVGIGFAIPSVLAEPVLQQLREHGRTHRGWLGVKIQLVTEEIADSLGLKDARGALVLEATEGSPAEKAGIKAGDVILSFNGNDIAQMRELPRIVAETKIGSKVPVKVWRDGREKTLRVILGELEEIEVASNDTGPFKKDSPEAKKGEDVFGMNLVTINDPLRQQLRLSRKVSGVLVVSIKAGSNAGRIGLAPRDIITQVNQQKVTNVRDIEGAIKQARRKGRKHILMRILRRGELLFATLPIAKK